ncbi:MAG: hypothetical protein AMJ88_15785 [Anaerolineae bacterium SM23_ 63]|nr:MAG: hypothetical protein AMJ88_15785 [Anaerolineae bacterium SM23_ 63]
MESNRRPKLLIVLCLGILFFSLVHLSGLVASFRLPDLRFPFPVWYFVLRNGIWSLIGLAASGALFLRRSWAASFTSYGALTYVFWYWIDRLIFTRSDFASRSWPATAVVTLIVLSSLFWVLRRPSLRYFLSENTS